MVDESEWFILFDSLYAQMLLLLSHSETIKKINSFKHACYNHITLCAIVQPQLFELVGTRQKLWNNREFGQLRLHINVCIYARYETSVWIIEVPLHIFLINRKKKRKVCRLHQNFVSLCLWVNSWPELWLN